jgi:hypothetical protein
VRFTYRDKVIRIFGGCLPLKNWHLRKTQ